MPYPNPNQNLNLKGKCLSLSDAHRHGHKHILQTIQSLSGQTFIFQTYTLIPCSRSCSLLPFGANSHVILCLPGPPVLYNTARGAGAW